MRSASLEERLAALQESIKIREQIFKYCTSIEEWTKSALIVEQLYAYTCEMLNARPLRIGDLEETQNVSIGPPVPPRGRMEKPGIPQPPPLKKKPKQNRKAEDAASLEALFKEFAAQIAEVKKNEESSS
jgi:hypothetical protein